MAKSAQMVSEDLRNALFNSDLNAITYSWPEFNKACSRVRMKDAFTEELRSELASRSILIAYGMSAVVLAKDYNFAPQS